MIRVTGPARTVPRGQLPSISSPLAVALGTAAGYPRPASVVGLEHEYSLSIAGAPLDFRDVIHDLGIPGQRLDPGDLNAYRCPSGLVITCDAGEAEIVSPPLPVRPGFAGDMVAWAQHGRAELRRLLPPDVDVTSFSTHISASMPDELVGAACELFARSFAPALMVMFGGADSHGVFVRPRPGRLEACGEHAMGGRLAAAATLVAGGSRASAMALAHGGSGHLPPMLAVEVRPARGRAGLFVGRRLAFGHDVLAARGQGALPLQAGGVIPLAVHLLDAWQAARTALGDDAGDSDLRAGDVIVAEHDLLDPDGPDDPGPPRGWAAPVMPSPFGDLLRSRRRPGLEVTPEAATWDFTVFRLTGFGRHAYASVPGPQLGVFLERLDAGSLDELLRRFMSAEPTGRVLVSHDDTAVAGLWDHAVIGADLLPYEHSDGAHAAPILLQSPASAGGRCNKNEGVAGAPGPEADAGEPAPVSPSVVAAVLAERPSAAAPGVRAAPAVVPPSADRPRPSPAPIARRSRGRSRRGGVLIGSLVILVVAGAAAVMTDLFTGGEPVAVTTPTSPTPPPPPSITETASSPATSPAEPTRTADLPRTTTGAAFPNPTVTSVPDPTVTSVANPTVTTLPAATTVPVTTTVPATTTTVSHGDLLLAAVTQGILGCGFQPPSPSATRGSAVRFRNDTGGGVTITITSPPGARTTISLASGATAPDYPLATAGSYSATCTPAGDGAVGRMTIAVTDA